MVELAGILDMMHRIVVVLFVAVTLMLMLVSAANRLRIRQIYLSWGTGTLGGIPALPGLFLLVVLPLFVVETFRATDEPILHPLLLAGYLLGGVFWYVAALVSQSLLVTPFGLIRNLNRSGKAVTWGQIEDYFASESGSRYVFLYRNENGDRRRLDVSVPRAVREGFRHVVAEKVDARFTFVLRRTYGKTALNG